MTLQEPAGKPQFELLAVTKDISTAQPANTSRNAPGPFFENAQWTADGTSILATLSTNQIANYVVPEDLLSPKEAALDLSAQSTVQLPERSNVLAPAPYFNLSEPYTHQVLVSSRDHPIQLLYFQSQSLAASESESDDDYLTGSEAQAHPPASSYPFIKPRSEVFETATALVWPTPGSHFIAGTRNLLAKFDISRTGSGPLLCVKTIPSERHLSKGGGVGMRGTISTLSAQPDGGGQHSGLMAAGTWTRWVGLYDFAASGQCVATWRVASATAEAVGVTEGDEGQNIGGGGITQTTWSPCGRYLLINERKSRGILVYDIRVTGKLLGWLAGRDALSNQRIDCDVFQGQEGSHGFEVWSGTTQGVVKAWEDVGSRQGAHQPSWEWEAHQAAVGSTCLHQSGSVIATCSGSWGFPDVASSSASPIPSSPSESDSDQVSNQVPAMGWMRRVTKESTLKLWGIQSPSNNGTGMAEEDVGGPP